MTRPLFVSIDGPKGTGKTTLLEAVTKALRADNKKVIRLCEKKSDPYRGGNHGPLSINWSETPPWTWS
ncbi:hypothetical protein PPS11_23144 [Pseudomonas putida S11]|nr:hypothetical protein PPS11_23144 [Pseudomonas putida S11]